jgi:MFS transporter, YNFM family, putative membrane transport protein
VQGGQDGDAASLVFCVYPLGSASSAAAGRLAERLGRPVVVLAGGLFATVGAAVSLASPLPVVILGIAMITAGFFAAHGIASGWAASAGQARQAASQASQASAFYLPVRSVSPRMTQSDAMGTDAAAHGE